MQEATRPGHEAPRDHAATTHLERYDANRVADEPARRQSVPSGFSGTGWALVDTASGKVLARRAWRLDALREQALAEEARRSDA